MITVAKDNSGDFNSIQDAINSITSYPETIFVKSGVYYEKLELKRSDVSVIGEDREGTIITYNDYAKMPMEDGTNRGTFRSYTMLAIGDNITLKNLTIENSAGFGGVVGQAVALFIEGNGIKVDNCKLLGHQDTLYTGPLPKKEKAPGGFRGPTEFAKRRVGNMCFTDCYICGEVDFIFGSAIAYFENCHIHCLNRGEKVNGYMTAPSTYEGCRYGYVFNKCDITGNCPDNTFYLGRPWRIYGKTVLLNCRIGSHIMPELFHDWNKPESHDTSYFGIYNCEYDNFDKERKAGFVHILTDEEALEYSKEKVLSYSFDEVF